MEYFKQYHLKNYKWILLLTVIGVSIFSVFIIGSAKESLQDRQIMGVILGIILMIIVSLFDYKFVLKFSWLWYIFGISLLVYVHFFGKTTNGATRWLAITDSFTVQPSEIVKILVIIVLSQYFSRFKDRVNTWWVMIGGFLIVSIPLYLILIQPDLSTTLCITAVFAVMLYLSGLSYKIIAPIFIIGIPLLIGTFLYVIQPEQQLISNYQQERILAWLYPEEYADDTAYQQINSIIAIGSGQLIGKGINNNTTTSVANGNFILEPQTDFIFAIIGEELGFRGCCIVIISLFFIVMQCIMIGMRCQIFAGKLICYNIASLIGIQSFINIGVATGVLPNTGITLPFISYGLSSLFSMMIGIGIVLNIGFQQKKIKGDIHEYRNIST